jgi:DNA-binding NarL/FixJ family response regulator
LAIEGFATHAPSRSLSACGEAPSPPRLTPRQLEVLTWLCEGLPNKLIARRLDIEAATVKVHISSILRELGVASRLQAAIAARSLGLVADPGAGVDASWPGYAAPGASSSVGTSRA